LRFSYRRDPVRMEMKGCFQDVLPAVSPAGEPSMVFLPISEWVSLRHCCRTSL